MFNYVCFKNYVKYNLHDGAQKLILVKLVGEKMVVNTKSVTCMLHGDKIFKGICFLIRCSYQTLKGKEFLPEANHGASLAKNFFQLFFRGFIRNISN